jgi:hypothetical protein
LGSQVSGVVETGVWTADKQPVALLAKKNDWIVQVIPQQAIKAIPVLSTSLYSKNGDPAAEAGMALFTTTSGLYGGVWCVVERRAPGTHYT